MQHWRDIYPNDYVEFDGRKFKPPKYYDKYYEEWDPDGMAQIRLQRMLDSEKHMDDNTPERLAVQEQVSLARVNQYRRRTL